MLNGGSLNSHALNNSAFTSATGEGQLVGIEQIVAIMGSGALVEVEQNVANIGSGALLTITQDVELRITGSGEVVEVEQDVITLGEGALISVGQQVLSAAQTDFFTRNGWDVSVSLGGYVIPSNTIQEVTVTHTINDDSRAEVKLNPGAASYNLYSYQGKQLVISARTGSSFVRIFTGIVDIPRIETVNEKIVLEGVASRENLIRTYMTPHVAGIGYYSTTVFGPRNNVFQEMTARMSSIPYDLDFDPSNNWTVTSWTPKASPDITLTDSSLYREEQPEVRIESAREIINKVGITLDYGYQRLHQASMSYTWNSSLTVCEFLTLGNTLPSREMIRNAASSAGWKVTAMSFTDLWASGFYHCSGTAIGWVNTRQQVILSNSTATDSSGNNFSTSRVVSQTDLNALLARAAQWTCKKRFTQNVVERYTLTVNSPQSQSLYGVREKNENLSLQADYDASQWEDEALYDSEFSGTKVSQSSTNYYINKDLQNTELNNAIVTILNKAKTEILASHRDTEVSFKTFINPNYQLRHTIELDTTRISGKGKVRSITHRFSADGMATSSVRLALYRAIGSTAETTIAPPSRPSNSAPAAMPSIGLNSRWGVNPAQPGAVNWTGYTGNKWVISGSGFNTNTYKTTYQESFIVDTPPIPEARREEQNYTQSASYNISIPSDDLTITFVDS